MHDFISQFFTEQNTNTSRVHRIRNIQLLDVTDFCRPRLFSHLTVQLYLTSDRSTRVKRYFKSSIGHNRIQPADNRLHERVWLHWQRQFFASGTSIHKRSTRERSCPAERSIYHKVLLLCVPQYTFDSVALLRTGQNESWDRPPVAECIVKRRPPFQTSRLIEVAHRSLIRFETSLIKKLIIICHTIEMPVCILCFIPQLSTLFCSQFLLVICHWRNTKF